MHSQELSIDAKFALDVTGSSRKALSNVAFRHFNSQLYLEGSLAEEQTVSTDDSQGEYIQNEEAERLLGKDLTDALNIDDKV